MTEAQRAALEIRKRLNEPEDFTAAAKEYLAQHGALKLTVRYEPSSDIRWDDESYRGEAYSGYAWSCDVAEVEIDLVESLTHRTTNEIGTMTHRSESDTFR